MSSWSPDVAIDDEIAERLILARFPELAPLSLRLLGRGWDNHAYLINNSIVFRIPHRKMGAELMQTECQVLEFLSHRCLPLRIPVPQYVAAPGGDFPYPIAGYPLIVGDTADQVQWTDADRALSAEPLGRFLKALHSIQADVPFALGDELRRAELQYRLPKVLEKIRSAPSGFVPLLEDLSKTPLHAEPPVWVHGDLYSRHLVVDSSHQPCGVIDWGDVHVGDPALDIAIAWMFLPPESWPVFIDSYGGKNENCWRRARFRAMTHWVYISEYASHQNDECLMRECEFVLRNVMEGA